jgi:hypothetical protein
MCLFVVFVLLFFIVIIVFAAAAAVEGLMQACGKVPLSRDRRTIEEA